MLDTFTVAADCALIDEGGYSDDPNDHGGRTNLGITQNELWGWCHVHGQLPMDVRELTKETALAIMHANYWTPWGDRLPKPFDYLWFDVNLNSGAHRATLILQEALEFSGRWLDGRMGVYTVSQCMLCQDVPILIEKFCAVHRNFLCGLASRDPTQERFLEGWLHRVEHEEVNAHAILTGQRPGS